MRWVGINRLGLNMGNGDMASEGKEGAGQRDKGVMG